MSLVMVDASARWCRWCSKRPKIEGDLDSDGNLVIVAKCHGSRETVVITAEELKSVRHIKVGKAFPKRPK